jgi:signal transduction histidine kinase
MMFDARTGFLFTGILSLVISLALWGALWRQRGLALHLWCGGGLAAALAALLLAFRGAWPACCDTTIISALALLMLTLKTQAIRLEVGEPGAVRTLAMPPVLALLGYQWLLASERTGAALVLMLTALLLMNAQVAGWALRLARRQRAASGYGIALAFGLMVVAYSLRLIHIALGLFDGEILRPGHHALLLTLASLIGIILSNIAWLGLALERLVREQVATAAARARDAEHRLLGEQIARLERQRSLGLLSASLAHELNQPLTAVLTNTQVARRGLSRGRLDAEQVAVLLDKALFNTRRASGILSRIRALIRPDLARRERVNLLALAREVSELVAGEARRTGVHLRLDGPEREVWVHGDAIQLSQILLNLLRNAIQAMTAADARNIQVRVWGDQDQAWLRVRDSGPGFSAEALARAGEPFFTTRVDGLGLGLSIAQAIAAQHGGRLRLGNAPAGGGEAELALPRSARADT